MAELALVRDLAARFATGGLAERRAAMEALYDWARQRRDEGADTRAAVPVLLQGLVDADEAVGGSAAWGLAQCAPHSLSGLIDALAHADAAVRERAAHALGNIGKAACDAGGALRRLMDDADSAVRARAMWSLGLIRDPAPATLAALWAMAARGTARDRGAALHALGNLGQTLDDDGASFRQHAPLLQAALRDEDDDVRWGALYVAESLGLSADETVGWLAPVLARDRSERVQRLVLRRFEALAPQADLRALLPSLLDVLTASSMASCACRVLGQMRAQALDAVPALRGLLADDELAVAAAQALWQITRDAEPLLPVLAARFADDGERICDLIADMGPAAAPLLPLLIEALGDDEYWDLQWAAADALAAVASTQADAQAALLTALSHDSPRVRSGAARGLANLGADAVPALQRLVADAADTRAAWAALALGRIGPAAAPAMGELRRGLQAGVEPLAQTCAIAMAEIGSLESLPALTALLARADADAPRVAAAQALASLGPAAAAAVPALREAAAQTDDDALADAAAMALDAIAGQPH